MAEATAFLLASDAIQKSGMVQLPGRYVEGAWDLLIAPGLVVRPEPRCPLTGVFTH